MLQKKDFIIKRCLYEAVTNCTLILRKIGWPSENWLFGRYMTVAEDYNMSKEMQELQKQWHSMVQSIHSNSNVGLDYNLSIKKLLS